MISQASFQRKSLPIEWVFGDDGKRHQFLIRGIKRETFASDVLLKWNGKAIGIAQAGEQEVAVPVLNKFDVLDVAIIHSAGSNPYVQVSFSDPLDKSVNLQGLVQIEDEDKDDYQVAAEGNRFGVVLDRNFLHRGRDERLAAKFSYHLPDRLGDFIAAIADIHAIQPGKRINRAAPLAVGDPYPTGGLDDPVAHLAPCELAQMRGRVEKVVMVPLCQLVVGQ